MSTGVLALMPAEEFDLFCAGVDAEAQAARESGFVSGDAMLKGEAAVAEAGRRRHR